MRKSCCLVSVFCFFLFLIVSCAGPSDQPRPVKGTQEVKIFYDAKKPYFWKVEKGGKVSYLLGTIHIGVSLNELFCSDVIQEKLKNSDLLFVELVSSSEQQGAVIDDLFSPNGEDFKRLSPSSQVFLKEKGVPNNLNCTGLNLVIPVICLQEVFGEQSLKIQMDEEVQSMAKTYGIPMKSLDEDEVVSQLKTVFTCEDVERDIKNYPACLERTKGFFDAYRTSSFTSEQINGALDNNVNKVLFKERNEQWLSKFESAHGKHDRIFVAAGTAHFIGDFNFIDMLKEKGFSIERVSCQYGVIQ